MTKRKLTSEELTQALNQIAREGVPETVNLWARVRAGVQPRVQTPRLRLSLITIAAAVIALVVLSVVLFAPAHNQSLFLALNAATSTPTAMPATLATVGPTPTLTATHRSYPAMSRDINVAVPKGLSKEAFKAFLIEQITANLPGIIDNLDPETYEQMAVQFWIPEHEGYTLLLQPATDQPSPTPGVSVERRYTVVVGDTIRAVAEKFHISEVVVRQYNHLTSDVLRVGQLLWIPADTTATPYGTPSNIVIVTVARSALSGDLSLLKPDAQVDIEGTYLVVDNKDWARRLPTPITSTPVIVTARLISPIVVSVDAQTVLFALSDQDAALLDWAIKAKIPLKVKPFSSEPYTPLFATLTVTPTVRPSATP